MVWDKILELELKLTRPKFFVYKKDGVEIKRILPKDEKTEEKYKNDIKILDEMLMLLKNRR